MNIIIGTTSKRSNSTSQTFNGVSLACKLKEPTSIHDPTFIVQGLSHGTMYNYASYNGFYYWVDDVIYMTNDIFEVHCHTDPLATFKTEICNTKSLILFGDNSHKTPFKDDFRFGPDIKLDRTTGVGTGGLSMGLDRNNWTVIMTCQASGNNFAYSGIVTYAMRPSTFSRVLWGFSSVVNSDIATWSTSDIFDILKNYAIRLLTGGIQAMDNIRGVNIVPIPYSTISAVGVSSNVIYMGPYQFGLDNGDTVSIIDPSYTSGGNSVISLARPIPNTTYKWLNSTKYCSIKICHPCGLEDINDNSLLNNSSIYLWWSLNYASGEYTIRITSESSKDSDTIKVISGCVAIDLLSLIPASNNSMDSNLHNSVGSIVPLVTGNIVQFNAGNHGPIGTMSNFNTGYSSIFNMTAGYEIFYDIEYYIPAIFSGGDSTEYNEYCSLYGYPVDRYLKVGDISGYCQCSNATVSNISGATESDKDIINNYLNSGIYIE